MQDVRSFCKQVVEIKENAERLRDAETQFEKNKIFLDISRELEALCKDNYGAEGISIFFGVEKKLY